MLQFTLELLDISSVDKPTVIIVNTKASTSKIINVNIIIIPHVHNIVHIISLHQGVIIIIIFSRS